MEPEADPILLGVAEAVADGVPVDWDALLAARPEHAESLRLLQLYQRILTAHREKPTTDREPRSG